jgi:hypothetical protein
MFFGKTVVALVAVLLTSTSNAAIMNFYSDQNCQNGAGSRNVYDNSCAPTGGFQSFMITSGGGSGQQITMYSRNACAGPYTACVGAGSVGTCFRSVNGNGGSNAVSSGPVCGAL